jgi:hypothetical protein
MFQTSGVDRVLEETVTRHHLWELADLAALAGKTYLRLHACRSATPCMQRPRLAAMSNHFSFLCSHLTLTGEEQSLLFATPKILAWSERVDLGL